jgi:hypothetical protein
MYGTGSLALAVKAVNMTAMKVVSSLIFLVFGWLCNEKERSTGGHDGDIADSHSQHNFGKAVPY